MLLKKKVARKYRVIPLIIRYIVNDKQTITMICRYPKSQQVTYKYYVGRKHMFDNNFKEAEEYLKFAFEHCHVKSRANKRSILIYLIPVKMLLGQMPDEMLLKKYELLQFKDVVLAVKQGKYLERIINVFCNVI